MIRKGRSSELISTILVLTNFDLNARRSKNSLASYFYRRTDKNCKTCLPIGREPGEKHLPRSSAEGGWYRGRLPARRSYASSVAGGESYFEFWGRKKFLVINHN